MPYWNKYPLRDRAGDQPTPAINVTSRGMGVLERYETSVRNNAESARLAAELKRKLDPSPDCPNDIEGSKP